MLLITLVILKINNHGFNITVRRLKVEVVINKMIEIATRLERGREKIINNLIFLSKSLKK